MTPDYIMTTNVYRNVHTSRGFAPAANARGRCLMRQVGDLGLSPTASDVSFT